MTWSRLTAMKRSTALHHVMELTGMAERLNGLGPDFDIRLSELWIGGDILNGAEQTEEVTIVVRLDIPDDEIPYLALHPEVESYEHSLRLNKWPVDARWRSRGVPAWDHEVRRVARFWSAETGTEDLLIRNLQDRTFTELMIESPTPEQLQAFLEESLSRSERHLTGVLEHYWDRDWRRNHQGYGVHPEDHLWRAAEAVRSIKSALRQFG